MNKSNPVRSLVCRNAGMLLSSAESSRGYVSEVKSDQTFSGAWLNMTINSGLVRCFSKAENDIFLDHHVHTEQVLKKPSRYAIGQGLIQWVGSVKMAGISDEI